MKRILFDDIHELANEMVADHIDGAQIVSAICLYDIATSLLTELIQLDVPIAQIDVSDCELSGYNKEYTITIMDGCVYCNPAFAMKKNGYKEDKYLETCADVAYIHQDCNSKLLNYIECDHMHEFAIDGIDEIDSCDDIESRDDSEDDITTYDSDSVMVSRDRHGNPTGFTKTWNYDDGEGFTQYTSYSYYCSNEDILRSMALSLDIEL